MKDLCAFSYLLSELPERGGGLNDWLWMSSMRLLRHMSPGEVVDTLRKMTEGKGVRYGEIERQVQRAGNYAGAPPGEKPSKHPPRWPKASLKILSSVLADSEGLNELKAASKVTFQGSDPYTSFILGALYPPGCLVCGGMTSAVFATAPLQEWLTNGSANLFQYLVPSPMSAPTGITQDGNESAHCLNNTGPRRFLVSEFDQGSDDEQARILVHLGKRAPLAMVVHSGGKSLHGWFYCQGRPEEQLLEFFRYAVALGADHHTWTRSQFVRMPGGTRDNGRHQQVLYFNPEVIR